MGFLNCADIKAYLSHTDRSVKLLVVVNESGLSLTQER